MSNNIPCARDCRDRAPGCHGRCGTYQQWNRERDRQREEAHRERELYHSASRSTAACCRRGRG